MRCFVHKERRTKKRYACLFHRASHMMLCAEFTVAHRLFQITNLMHNSFILQQYVCYNTILNMFRAAHCSSSGGQIVSPQHLVSSPSVNSRTVCRYTVYLHTVWLQSALNLHTVRLFTKGDDTKGSGDTIGPPEDEQCAARNMLRIVV